MRTELCRCPRRSSGGRGVPRHDVPVGLRLDAAQGLGRAAARHSWKRSRAGRMSSSSSRSGPPTGIPRRTSVIRRQSSCGMCWAMTSRRTAGAVRVRAPDAGGPAGLVPGLGLLRAAEPGRRLGPSLHGGDGLRPADHRNELEREHGVHDAGDQLPAGLRTGGGAGGGWREVPTYRGHRWAEPSRASASGRTRRVADDRSVGAGARAAGAGGRVRALQRGGGRTTDDGGAVPGLGEKPPASCHG